MSEPLAHAEAFHRQADQSRDRAPRYSAICERLADDARVAGILESPPQWDAPLRLMSALHSLVLSGRASWDDVDAALDEHADVLRAFVAEHGVQTNEVQRCWMLLPCFLEAVHRTGNPVLDIIELGPSAGLNLGWDRYRYQYAAGSWGPADARLELRGIERGAVPAELLALEPRVRSRVGIDLNPLDVTTDEGSTLLRSFVWLDMTWRLEQLERAIAVLRDDPPTLAHGDIADVLPGLLHDRADDALTLVWQTAVLGYLPPDRRALVLDALAEQGELAASGSRGPLAFVQTTAADDASWQYYGLTLQVWPGGEAQQVAHADFHGAWIDWRGDAAPPAGPDGYQSL